MGDISIVKMSANGPLVVPEEVRIDEGFTPGDLFIPVPMGNGILFKKFITPAMRKELERSLRDIRAEAKRKGVTTNTIDEAVRWARRSSS